MKEKLTKDIAYKALKHFFYEKPFVLFGTGTSCAVDPRFGMNALKEKLIAMIPKRIKNNNVRQEWESVVRSLLNNEDFETAMNEVHDEELRNHVTSVTADFLVSIEKEYSARILTGDLTWPAGSMFEKLVNGLPKSDPTLHVATPNYDLLAEYAFENASIPYITGYPGGVCPKLDWDVCARSMTYLENAPYNRKIRTVTKVRNHIRLYKVHGSLNLFKLKANMVQNNLWMIEKPSNVSRMLIMPGNEKHTQLMRDRDAYLTGFDQAVRNHSAFLFIGFGFNDIQLSEDQIEKKLKVNRSPGLIITMDSNGRIDELVGESENLWLVCRSPINQNQTRIKNSKFSKPLDLDNQIWKIDEFTREILGA